jgi:hypothetical protein
VTRRLRRRRVWLLIGLVVGAWAAIAAFHLFYARVDSLAGRSAGEAANEQVSPDEILDGEPLPELRTARARFARAHNHLRSLFVAPVKMLPVVGRQVRAADALASAAVRVADTGIAAVTDARTVLDAPHRTGPQRIDVLRRLAGVAERANHDLTGLSLGPSDALIGPIARARNELADDLDRTLTGLRRGASGARAAAELLAGPRNILILAANNAEMRSGSGMFLSAGVMTTDNGTIDVGDLTPTPDLRVAPGLVPVTGDFGDRWGWMNPTQEWRNLGASPRFDVAGPLAARMWEASGRGSVDGVLALDVAALRATLEVIGPVNVNGREVDEDNVVELLLHQQYLDHANDPSQDPRREELGQIARAVVDGVQDRDWSVADMARELGEAARGRHILAWSRTTDEQEAWKSAGVDGAVDPNSVLVGILNRGGNKLDRFLDVDASLDIDVPAKPDTDPAVAVLRVHLRNPVPTGEPRYVAGPEGDSGLAEGEYGGIVAVTLPGGVTDLSVSGYSAYAAIGPDGPTYVVAPAVRLVRGARRTLEFRFTLPPGLRDVRIEPSARVPAVAWRSGGESWTDVESHIVRW